MKHNKISENDISFIRDLPKVELHLHLEGAIPLSTLLQIIHKYGSKDFISYNELEKKFEYSDFSHFLDIWAWKNTFIREYEDFELIAENVALDLANQNIRYAEISFSPTDFRRSNLLPQQIAIAIRKGLNKHSDKILINLIADLVRDKVDKIPQFHQILEVQNQGIIGIGLGGKELEFPPKLFTNVYKEARKHGLKTTCHAGEAAGPDYIWQAILDLKSDRIGHGTSAMEDLNLIDYLIDNQIPVEMNPISNVRTNSVDSLAKHPIYDFYKKGMLVSVNTDDPKMFNTSLENEYLFLMESFKITWTDIIALTRNAINSAWCSPDIQDRLNEELNNYYQSYLKVLNNQTISSA